MPAAAFCAASRTAVADCTKSLRAAVTCSALNACPRRRRLSSEASMPESIGETQNLGIGDYPAARTQEFIVLAGGITNDLAYVGGGAEEVEPDVAGAVNVRGFAGAGESGGWI